MNPISFYITRSFWLGILPALMVALDAFVQLFLDPQMGPPVASMVAWLLSIFFEVDPVQVEAVLLKMAPVFALIVAHQRRGSARPYTAKWTGG